MELLVVLLVVVVVISWAWVRLRSERAEMYVLVREQVDQAARRQRQYYDYMAEHSAQLRLAGEVLHDAGNALQARHHPDGRVIADVGSLLRRTECYPVMLRAEDRELALVLGVACDAMDLAGERQLLAKLIHTGLRTVASRLYFAVMELGGGAPEEGTSQLRARIACVLQETRHLVSSRPGQEIVGRDVDDMLTEMLWWLRRAQRQKDLQSSGDALGPSLAALKTEAEAQVMGYTIGLPGARTHREGLDSARAAAERMVAKRRREDGSSSPN